MSCEQADPRAAKSAERIEGAMMAGGDIVEFDGYGRKVWCTMGVQGVNECASEILNKAKSIPTKKSKSIKKSGSWNGHGMAD